MAGAEPFSHDGSDVGVVVCHGFTGSPQGMRPVAEHLAEVGYTVRLPRLPGHGTTWQEMNRTTWQDWYATVNASFLELRQRCTTVVAVGLSMGGCLATHLAQEHGPRVGGLVLMNPAFKVDDIRLKALPLLQHVLPSLPGIANDIKKEGQHELAYDRIPLRALHSQTQMWSTVVRDLPEVTQPVLLLRSAEDHVVPASSSALFLARISSTDVTEIVLQDSYHVMTLDHDAPRVIAETTAFIDRVTKA